MIDSPPDFRSRLLYVGRGNLTSTISAIILKDLMSFSTETYLTYLTSVRPTKRERWQTTSHRCSQLKIEEKRNLENFLSWQGQILPSGQLGEVAIELSLNLTT